MTSKISTKSGVRKKHPKRKASPRELRTRGWSVMGFDLSMSSIAGAAIGYDATLQKYLGPKFLYLRWEKDDDYFARLKEAANSQLLVEGLLSELGMLLSLDEIFIAQEEPWPVGMASRGGMSSWLKQQAEISGAFLGGLVRWGYTNVSQINSIHWRKIVADDLGITTHHSKWRDPGVALEYNCAPKDSGKFRSKQWALNYFDGDDYTNEDIGNFSEEIPEWPDIIKTKDGNHPRPEGSVAKAIQPDDRYDALAVCWTHYLELQELDVLG